MATKKPRSNESNSPKEAPAIPARLLALLKETAAPKRFVNPAPVSVRQLREPLGQPNPKPSVPVERLVESGNCIKPDVVWPVTKSEEIQSSLRRLKPGTAVISMAPQDIADVVSVSVACLRRAPQVRLHVERRGADRHEAAVQRIESASLGQLRGSMGDPGRDPNPYRIIQHFSAYRRFRLATHFRPIRRPRHDPG